VNWFFKRLSEPSTWAGIAAVIFGGGTAAELNPALSPDFIAAAGATIAGVIAILKGSPSVRKDEQF
jgi:hypothetical protein